MEEMKLLPIGYVRQGEEGCVIEMKEEYRAAMKGLDDFGYIQVLWWANGCDTPVDRENLTELKPYVHGPEELGTFATRSPRRPNPIAVTTAYRIWQDAGRGLIGLSWLDAEDGTPVLDIKPYTPSVDRVEAPEMPEWCRHWPNSVETSGEFDWEQEFNF